jgi:predicted molibdopterin-dependent oxidoreductase YjgC
VLRADVTERIQPGVVYTTFHFPESGANVITTDSVRLGHQLPGIQGDGGAGHAGGAAV